MKSKFKLLYIWILAGQLVFGLPLEEPESEAEEMSMETALSILSDSPWARMQTITRVVSGVGSGEYGEKEIFSRYYVRILSAPPIERAYTSIQASLNRETAGDTDVQPQQSVSSYSSDDYHILGVAFRSNNPDIENRVNNTLRSQTAETLRNRAFLSTERFPRLELIAYFPPSEAAIGAQFVFPKRFQGQPVISEDDSSFAFELDVPNERSRIRVTFPVSEELFGENEPTPDATRESAEISEFRVVDSSTSGTVNLSSSRFAGVVNQFPQQKTGRAFHGSLYEYHRNDNLDARNFFDPVGEPLPEFKRNQFGASLGVQLGPRINIFGSYDGLRINQGSTLVSNVPSEAMKSGDFSELLELEDPVQLYDPVSGQPIPGNLIPSDRIHPVSKKLLPLIPDPNRDEDVRNFINSQPIVDNRDTINLRLDLGLGEKNLVSAQYSMEYADGIEVHPFPAFGAREQGRVYEGQVSYTRTFNDNTVGSLRAEFDRVEELELARDERPAGLLDAIGIEGVKVEGPEDEGFPAFDLAGYPEFGDESLPQHEVENRYGLEGELTLVRGNHLLSFSGEFDIRQLNDSRSNSLERGAFGFSGLYSGHAFADYLLGRADTATRAIGSSRQDQRGKSFELGFVEEWKVHDRLTMTFGLGYQYQGPFHTIRNNISVFRPLLFEPPPDGELIDLGDSGENPANAITTVVQQDRNDFFPRIGLAYRPFGDSRYVIRASYSIDYDPLPSWIYENYMGRNYPYYFLQRAQASVDSSGLDLASPFDTSTATELGVREITPDLRTPYEQRWDVRFQNQITDDWSLELSHRGRRSLKSFRIIPANVPNPGPGPIQTRRPNPDYGQFALVTSGGSSLFYEFQVDLRRRFQKGFTFDVSFELRRRFDDDFSENPSDPRNLRAEWGPSQGFPDRRLVLNYIWDLPFGEGRAFGKVPGVDFFMGGWRLSGIAVLTSGEPFTVVLPGDPNNDGLSNDRPDRLSSGHLPASERSIDQWFDTSAFQAPDEYSFGDSGRNILLGPSYHNWDVSLIKDFILANNHRFQIRFAFFNAFNHPNFENPDQTLGTRTFGVITGAKRAREIELALKYSF